VAFYISEFHSPEIAGPSRSSSRARALTPQARLKWAVFITRAQLVDGLENATSISNGFLFSCAALADTTVACWGVNPGESAADHAATVSATPVAVPEAAPPLYGATRPGVLAALRAPGAPNRRLRRTWGPRRLRTLARGRQVEGALRGDIFCCPSADARPACR
jgi:hypothetical protein